MAKNWTIAELTECIIKGGDEAKTAIADVGKRYALTTNLINRIVTAIGGNSIALASFSELNPLELILFISSIPNSNLFSFIKPSVWPCMLYSSLSTGTSSCTKILAFFR